MTRAEWKQKHEAMIATGAITEMERLDPLLKVCKECGDLRANCTGDEDTYDAEEVA